MSVLLYEPLELSQLAITHQLEQLNCQVDPVQNRHTLTKHLESGNHNLILISQEDRPLKSVLSEATELSHSAPVLVLTIARSTDEYPDLLPAKVWTLSKPVSLLKLSDALSSIVAGKPNNRHQSYHQVLKQQRSILVVDDNPVNVKLLKTMLENIGQEVETASSGFEAIERCQRSQFDLILMDVQMPGLDGIEATRIIRDMDTVCPSLPIIAVTAHALPDERKLILQSGMNDYMTKPVNLRQLSNTVSHWTNHLVTNKPIQNNLSSDNRLLIEQSDYSGRTKDEGINENSPVDRERSIQLAGGNPDLADEMLHMLIAGLDEDLKVIKRHKSIRYYKGMLERVHRLHGSSRYCGVPELQESCFQLESRLKQSDQTQLLNIEEELNNLYTAIYNLQAWYKPQPNETREASETALTR